MAVDGAPARRLAYSVALSAAVAFAVGMITPLIGSAPLSYSRAFAGQSPDFEILFYARVPRVLLSLIAGGGLAVAGVLFQAVLRDALATPFTLGISAGASLGAVITISAGIGTIAAVPATWFGAALGAFTTLLIVMAVATEGRRMSSFTLLLTGTTVNSISMAGILFLQNLSTFGQSFAIVRWLMGGIEAVNYSTLAWIGSLVVAASCVLFFKAREWNVLAVGEEWAEARGVSTSRLLLTGYLAGSLIAGSVTALTGPIGFVGLIVPHALRLRLGADHRILLPCAFFLGAAFLAICDVVARTLLAPSEIPVGVITAMLGGPFFIYLLRSRRKAAVSGG